MYTQVIAGAALGYVAGLGTWLVARAFTSQYHAKQAGQFDTRRPNFLNGSLGLTSIGAALVQAAMTLWGAYLGWQDAGWPRVLAALILAGLLLTISLIDLRTHRIPDALVAALGLCALAQMLWLGQPTASRAALGLAASGGLFGLIALAGRGAMGSGDVKLAAALGALLGFPLALTALLYGVLAGGAAALVVLATRRSGRKDAMAYGPFLALGGWIVWVQAWGFWP